MLTMLYLLLRWGAIWMAASILLTPLLCWLIFKLGRDGQ